MIRALLITSITLCFVGCSTHRSADPTNLLGGSDPWLTTAGSEHPLVGRIWLVGAGRFGSWAELTERAAAAPYLLLGEQHDHPDHHRIQAALVAVRPRHTPVRFEMLDEDDQPAQETPTAFAASVAWEHSRWPSFALYEPLVAASLAAGHVLLPASPSRARVRDTMMSGLQTLPAEERATLGLDRPLPATHAAALASEIEAAHCGHANAQLVEMMTAGQRLKDAWMARELLKAPVGVLVAGGGHARTDRGVGAHLPSGRALAVLPVAVQDEARRPQDYDATGYDVLVFTPRLDDLDPCETFREQLKNLGPAQ